MAKPHAQLTARYYARFAEPLDPDHGWRCEDIQLAFMRGMEEQCLQRPLPMKEVAELMAVSTATIRDLVHHGELSHDKVGRGTKGSRLLFAPEKIENFIKRHTTRDFPISSPVTQRYGTRKRGKGLAVERATEGEIGFLARHKALLTEREATKEAAKKK